ncbi:MAG: hypothetical protein GX456_17405 [Verrucomicrobia bacterium]|nr:hypothetical protein [Verrucomicrobiota bacterium]
MLVSKPPKSGHAGGWWHASGSQNTASRTLHETFQKAGLKRCGAYCRLWERDY